MKRINNEEFRKQLFKNNKKAFEELEQLELYIDKRTKILFKDKYGILSLMPTSLLQGRGWSIQSSIDKHGYFLNMLKESNIDAYLNLNFLEDFTKYDNNILAMTKYGKIRISPDCLLKGQYFNISSAVNKTEFFIAQAKEVHGDEYNYDKTIFISANKKMIITCKKHGDFETLSNNHLTRKCKKCMDEKNGINCRLDSNLVYKNVMDKKNKCLDIISFNYTGRKSKIRVRCVECNRVWDMPYDNIIKGAGCRKCLDIKNGKNKMKSTEQFIKEANIVHSNKYDYSKTVYTGNKNKVKILCNEHGLFEQEAKSHILGSGYPLCNCGVYQNLDNWSNLEKESKKFESFKLYKIHCWNNNENFYKIGITSTKVNCRFTKSNLPYNYEIIEIIKSDSAEYIWNLEKELHRQHKEFQYTPKLSFGGMTECFSKLI